MPYVDYESLTIAQKAEIERLPWLDVSAERGRFAFWVKPDGHVSRRSGHKQLTAVESAKIDAELKGNEVRSRTATENWKPGTTFHNAPERPMGSILSTCCEGPECLICAGDPAAAQRANNKHFPWPEPSPQGQTKEGGR